MSDDLKPYMYRLGSFDAYENALREAGAEHQRTIESLRGRNIECVKLQSRVTDLEAKLKVAKIALNHINGEGFDYCALCSEFNVTSDDICKHYDEIAQVALKQLGEDV